MRSSKKRSCWTSVKEMRGDYKILWGKHLSYQAFNSPRKILYMMSYYKFASKIIGFKKRILDIGCGEGMGTWLLAVECGQAKGIDIDCEAIEVGRNNWKAPRISFDCIDFLNLSRETCDAIVSFDVIEHILTENITVFWQKVSDCLVHDGIAIIGTPNMTSNQYASEITRAGHINLYSGERLEAEMREYFTHVFMFGANDEVIHTGFLPMSHYLVAIGCRKRK